jgi:N-acetylated-alpha-linked acidic dipeptidase
LQTGSTEWVEENRAMLTSRTVAYLNVDIAVDGYGFYASATPQLDELLKETSKQV